MPQPAKSLTMAKKFITRSETYRDWFDWSKQEQRGIVVLCSIIALLIIYNLSLRFVDSRSNNAGTSGIHFLAISADSTMQNAQSEATTEKHRELFPFNPNTLDDDGWKRLGFLEGQIKSIRKFLGKGGTFRKPADVARMFVISEVEFDRIFPFLIFTDEGQERKAKASNSAVIDTTGNPNAYFNKPGYVKKSKTMVVELNSADTTDLKQLYGIGSYLAAKIVEYGRKLGGYNRVEQLTEIYRFSPEKLDTLRANFVVDISLVTKLDINAVGLEQLLSHPYFTSAQAKALLAYRDRHGMFATVDDIRKCVLIDDKTFEKVVEYLEVR